MADLTLTGVNNPNYNKNALPGQAGSLDPTASVTPNEQTTGNAYNLSATPAAGGRSLYTPQSGTDLTNTLNTSFENSAPYQSILSSYQGAQGKTAEAYGAARQQIGTSYGQDIQQQEQSNRVALDNTMTSRSLATNTALLAQQQDQADYRIKNIRDQMNAALAANNTAAASKLADLATTEQATITNARTAFLSNYFNTQTEARTQASFQTPEQTAVIDLAKSYPDANISPADTLSTAQAKVSAGSQLYKTGLTAAKAGITLTGAQAGAAGASAAQTNLITNLMSGTPGSQEQTFAALDSGAITPQQLQSNMANWPGGAGNVAYNNLMSAYNARGGKNNQNIKTLTAQGQEAQTAALNSGSPIDVMGGLFSQAAGGIMNSFSGTPRYSSLTNQGPDAGRTITRPASGTDGAAFGFPGYVSNGTAWVKK